MHLRANRVGDRACLALAVRLDALVLTAGTAWSRLDLQVELRQVR
jgi:PIN domain nuclease of toxin-antitoxin system